MSSNRTVYIPIATRSRVHRRREVIIDSFQDGQVVDVETHNTQETQEGLEEEHREGIVNLIAINWTDFWKRVKIYPDRPVAYPDASGYISSRRRTRHQVQSVASDVASAYLSDTDSESGMDEIAPCRAGETTCMGCKDGQANQTAHMDYGGCLCNDVVV